MTAEFIAFPKIGGSRTMFKVTLENDELSKGEAEALQKAA